MGWLRLYLRWFAARARSPSAVRRVGFAAVFAVERGLIFAALATAVHVARQTHTSLYVSGIHVEFSQGRTRVTAERRGAARVH